jgi:hypothetical protein
MTRHPLIILAFLPLAACGGMAGTYSCENIGFLDSIELTSNGKAFVENKIVGTSQKIATTYEVEGKRLIIHAGGLAGVFDIEDGNLVAGDGQCTRQ